MEEPLYTRDGDMYVPSAHTQGPWVAGAQHGGAPAALLARELEGLGGGAPGAIVRCTVDLLRPVPMAPVATEAAVERPGRRVQLLRAVLRDAQGTAVCVANAWWIRTQRLDVELPEPAPPPFALPEQSAAHAPENDQPAFHRTGVELRFARGSFWETGPSAVWVRLRHDVVAGETPSPLQRVLAAADFGNGVGSALPWGRYRYINTDVSVSLQREPEGAWIGLDASTVVNGNGTGIARSALYDTRGAIGHAAQTLLVDELERDERP